MAGQIVHSHPPGIRKESRGFEHKYEAMKDSGYKTFFAGKWHLGSKGSCLPTRDSISIKVAGMWAVPVVDSSHINPTWIQNDENPLHPIRRGNCRFY